ncbi:Ig domain-containing protein [Paenibacillus selenitireducens]|uniref:Ig domain-containing protein n=1 Tax=Paenibacillus selenitireducens TaxID=1324314 RepID=A0A1T2X0F7_9BACL|nr:LamG-like jellyroll fold domain-containing protein [Paenibacillus selenitireducens]OPA73295.1 Ig domain-containing protein [Paenibacillus selenitireducens]
MTLREMQDRSGGEEALPRVVAHWEFSADNVLSGSMEEGCLIIKDRSGNGNHLESVSIPCAADRPEPIGEQRSLQWEHDPQRGEVLGFYNDIDSAARSYFRTIAQAPLNELTFEEGYTIEAVIRLPHPFDEVRHSWMGVLTRQGSGAELGRQGEQELLATLSVSNCMEYQWVYHPNQGDTSATSWSRYLKEEEWHHVVIVNDTKKTLLYVNGICDYACLQQDLHGLATIKGKGWNVGASEWNGRLDTLFSGRLSEIRVTDKPLDKSEWLDDLKPLQILEGTNEGEIALHHESNYHFVFIPDPQKLVYLNPHMFHAQVEWVKQRRAEANIAMTAFLGDVVDHSNRREEWERASLAISTLDHEGIPYVMTAGNHDYDEADTYLAYFGPHRFKDKSYVKGYAPSCYSSYGIIEAGSYTYLWLMVDMKHLQSDIHWCKKVLDQHSELPTLVVSHDILYKNHALQLEESPNGRIIWEELVAPYDQVFMTVNGHYDGTGHQVRTNSHGLEVIQLLINYQDSYRGGNGWLRLAEFDEAYNHIIFRTFSPWVEQMAASEEPSYPDYRFLTGEDHSFTIPLHFKERFGQLQPSIS